MAIYIAVMVILGAPILAAVLTSSRATKENDTFAKVEERNRAVLNRLERDIRTSVSGTHSVSNSGRTLSFTSAAGFDGTNIINGPVVTYTLQASSGETLNNADDDGDQLIDEGDLVRTSNATSVTISGGLNMNASSFAISGSGVVLSITTFGSLDRRFGTYSSVKSVTVYPRN